MAEALGRQVGEVALDTVGVDLTAATNFYVVGSSGSGRTTVMRTLVTAIQDAFTPTQAQIVAFDPDLKLAAYIEPQYLAVHIDNPSVDVGAIAAHLAKRFTSERRPPENATAHERAQWRFSGPRYFIVIDDLHLFNAPGSTMASRLSLMKALSLSRSALRSAKVG